MNWYVTENTTLHTLIAVKKAWIQDTRPYWRHCSTYTSSWLHRTAATPPPVSAAFRLAPLLDLNPSVRAASAQPNDETAPPAPPAPAPTAPGARVTKKCPCEIPCQLTKIFKPGIWLAGSTAASQSEAMLVYQHAILHGFYLVTPSPDDKLNHWLYKWLLQASFWSQ